MRKILWAFLLAALSAGLVAGGAWAQENPPRPATADEINAVAKQMYCPVCENIPLDVCPTQACAEWRDLIKDKLQAGWSDDQIKIYFVEQFGDRVLATPPARGLNWLVYVFPPLVFLGGVAVLYKAFRTWNQPPDLVAASIEAAEPENQDDEYVRRLEEELRKL
jgi:cytochrome c-type biogenesis protein CcmH